MAPPAVEPEYIARHRRAMERVQARKFTLPRVGELEKIKLDTVPPNTVTVDTWRRRPCDVVEFKSDEERLEAINAYFDKCAAENRRPLLTGVAMVAGYSGVTEMRRAAMRDTSIRWALSRVYTAIASYYEEMVGTVAGSGPLFMLKNMPDYDDLDKEGAPAERPFQERIVVEEHVTGVRSVDTEGADLTPRLAYLKLIQGAVVDLEEEEEAMAEEVEYSIITDVELRGK